MAVEADPHQPPGSGVNGEIEDVGELRQAGGLDKEDDSRGRDRVGADIMHINILTLRVTPTSP